MTVSDMKNLKNFGKIIPKKTKELLNFLQIKKAAKIRDIGCGRGNITFYLARLGIKAVGIDYSKEAIVLANESRKNIIKEYRRIHHF